MTGIVVALILAAIAFGGMVVIGIPRAMWSFVGAALCLGAAGYAWQGRPGLAASAPRPRANTVMLDPAAIALRDQLFGRFTADTAYVAAADAMMRAGHDDAAARVILGGVRAIPSSFILWTALGTTLATSSGGEVAPPSLFAFRRAMRLAPNHPAPAYYAGLAYIEAGDLDRGGRLLRRAVALSTPGSRYRATIEGQSALLDRLIAAQRAGAFEAPAR